MIKLGDGWIAEDDRILHECGPALRVALPEARSHCDGGRAVPRHVRNFEVWLAGGRRGVQIDALLRDEGPVELLESSEAESEPS